MTIAGSREDSVLKRTRDNVVQGTGRVLGRAHKDANATHFICIVSRSA